MKRQQNPPPPKGAWFTVRPLRENLRAVDMNAEGIYVGYTGRAAMPLGWRRLNSRSYELVPMDIPGNGFGSIPKHIADDGAITGQSLHPGNTFRPYLWTPSRGNVVLPGLNDNHAPLVGAHMDKSGPVLAGNHGNRAYVVSGEAVAFLPLPERATRSEAHSLQLLEWKDRRGTHRDHLILGSVTFQDGPIPALWYRDEGRSVWEMSVSEGRFGMAGAILRGAQEEIALGSTITGDIIVDEKPKPQVVRCFSLGYSMVEGKKRASLYWYWRDGNSLGGMRLPLLMTGHESVAQASLYNQKGKRLICGFSGERAVLWEFEIARRLEVEGVKAHDLNEVVEKAASVVLAEAVAISKTGMILCNGTQRGVPWAFLLEPTAAGRSRLNLQL